MIEIPPFSSLPIQKDGPPLNAWGLYGKDDELGRLNLITPEAVKRGRDSINHGIVVNLNLPLTMEPLSPATRAQGKLNILKRENFNDDELSFNTQSSSQWDGFRHYPYQNWPQKGEMTFYGGMTHDEAADPKSLKMGVQNYASKPITSRGVLLDIDEYITSNSLPPLKVFDNTTPITVAHLDGCAKAQGVEILPGDILLVRAGWGKAFFALSEEDRRKDEIKLKTTGLERSEEVIRWHWEKGIAAVASDVRAYESYPSSSTLVLHETFLAGWGMPLGELFDLEELSKVCKEKNQYTFLFTSMALNVPGGIASPPNAQAIL